MKKYGEKKDREYQKEIWRQQGLWHESVQPYVVSPRHRQQRQSEVYSSNPYYSNDATDPPPPYEESSNNRGTANSSRSHSAHSSTASTGTYNLGDPRMERHVGSGGYNDRSGRVNNTGDSNSRHQKSGHGKAAYGSSHGTSQRER